MSRFDAAHRRRVSCLIPILGAAIATGAWGADTDPDVLDEIVVTATRMESSVRDVARSISVIQKEQIQKSTQKLGLGEVLAGVPGLYIQNRYNFSQDLRISLRGFGSRSSFGIRGIRIYVDGIPETLPDGQAQVDSIDLGSAKSIEVLRGPASSLYGNASGGVIAIETELGDTPPFIETGAAGGELGYRNYHVKTGGSYQWLDYLFNVSRQEIDGYRDHSFARGSLVNGKLRIHLNDDDRLTIALNNTDQPIAEDPGALDLAHAASAPRSANGGNVLFDAGEELSQQRLGFVYERDRPAGKLTLRNYYVWRDFGNRLPFVDGGAVDIGRFFYGAGIQYSPGDLLPEALDLTFGLDVDRQNDDRQRFDNEQGVEGDLAFDQRERVDSTGLYLQGQYDINDRWTASAGLRYDELTFDVDDHFLSDGDDSGKIEFDQLSPSAGLNLKLGRDMIFGSFSRSFATPTTTELANPDGSGGFNPSLQPQLADNYELGVKGDHSNIYYEFAVFHIDLDDELVPFELAAFPGRTFYSNAGTSDRSGIETAVSWHNDRGLSADISYTWSDFTYERFVDDGGNDFGGKRLPGVPEHFAYAGLSYQADNGLYAMLDLRYSGSLYATNANDVEVGSFAVTSFRVSRDFDNGRWDIRPYLGVNNIFNARYFGNVRSNAFGGRYYEPAPMRNVYAGFNVRYRPGG